ncbi:chromatin remodelling complex Rsc7/Swp82 subunit-domain-containing protein [Microdochium bolleyi]|uniref:Chromatin remodelling complex Rsc7/Swp82 subunit-domain-containing protein n=1 Tax=Microdochium bolleyi TaxID=196109 RepID=A0A136J445_9PEZI|nr:chromatin remodelling complex Rsc7/Swp82 subunit-domain-containing protein [Microdochium bolleyi]
MGRRPGRAAAKRAAQKLENTPQTVEEMEDSMMPDADEAGDNDSAAEAQANDDDVDEDEDGGRAAQDGGDEDEEDEEGNNQSEGGSAKSPSPAPEPVIRKRRLGRPPKNRPPDWDQLPIERPNHDPNETPKRRGRGGYRGRGGKKGQPAAPTQQEIDKEGTMADIVDDELLLPEDPEGETKVDKMGNLLGAREYRCRTFTVAGRGDRLYMLSTEPARCVGFRDSYLFFTKHRKLYKIIINDEEKRDLIERELIPHSYKGRAIGIVTARSVFREFGSLIVVGGRRIVDDYEVARLRAEGVPEGAIADPTDAFNPNEPYNKNQYVAWHGASAVYHTNVPSALPAQAVRPEVKKRKVNVNDTNWQLEHAREASRFNAEIGAIRKHNNLGVYELHTNIMHYPAFMQPTHARIEQIPPATTTDDSTSQTSPAASSSAFPPLDPKIARNFRVIDTAMEHPPSGIATQAMETHDVPSFLADFQGLAAVSDDIRDLLPAECRAAFDSAAEKERSWKAAWGPEAQHGHRRQPIIDAAIVPYSRG